MKRKKTQGIKYLQFVVLVLFVFALFAPSNKNKTWMLMIIIAGIAGLSLSLLANAIPHLNLYWPRKPKRRKTHFSQDDNSDSGLEALLLCQISHRITGKLQSAYPKATWNWERQPIVSEFLDGTILRIQTKNTNEFNHAELCMDQYGNLRLQMLVIEPLKKSDETQKPAEQSVDPQAWYDLIGRSILEKVIQDVHSRGYQKLFINKQGELYITEGDKKEVKETFEHFPPKVHWAALTDILKSDELAAVETDNGLELTWAQ